MTARDFEAIRCTKYAEECVHLISVAAEHATDAYLVQIVKLLFVADKIGRTLNSQDFDPSSNIFAPIGATVRLLEAELLKLKPTFPAGQVLSLENRKWLPYTQGYKVANELIFHPDLLLIHYYAIEAYLYEIALDEKIEASHYGTFPATRLSLLFACLTSTKRFYEIFYAMPAQMYFNLAYPTWALIGHLYVLVSKLSLVAVDGWDREHASNTVNFNVVMNKLSAKIEEATALVLSKDQQTGPVPGLPERVPLIFTTIEGKIRDIKAVHEGRTAELARRDQQSTLVSISERPTTQSQLADTHGASTVPLDDLNWSSTFDFFDFSDEPFWVQGYT
jgi:hypothetical protein